MLKYFTLKCHPNRKPSIRDLLRSHDEASFGRCITAKIPTHASMIETAVQIGPTSVYRATFGPYFTFFCRNNSRPKRWNNSCAPMYSGLNVKLRAMSAYRRTSRRLVMTVVTTVGIGMKGVQNGRVGYGRSWEGEAREGDHACSGQVPACHHRSTTDERTTVRPWSRSDKFQGCEVHMCRQAQSAWHVSKRSAFCREWVTSLFPKWKIFFGASSVANLKVQNTFSFIET